MSGVIDENGQQWEHCDECGKWVAIQDLYNEPPSLPDHRSGRDLCHKCFEISMTSKNWDAVQRYDMMRSAGEDKLAFQTRVANELRCLDAKIVSFSMDDTTAILHYQN